MKKILLIVTSLVFFVLSCGNKNNESSSQTLVINAQEEAKSYDPQLANDASGELVLSLIGEGLFKDGDNGEAVLGLAESYEVSEDGLSWTFNIRKDAKWSNGDPITAQNFKDGWIRALNPETASEYAFMLYSIKNAEKYNNGDVSADEVGIEVVDEHTLKVELSSPLAYFPSLTKIFTYMPLNEGFYETVGERYMTSKETSISSGPYIIESWTPDSEIVLVKNPEYWDKDSYKLDTIKIVFVSDETAAIEGFKNGDFDITNISAIQSVQFENDPAYNVVGDGSVWYIIYNLNNKVLSNKKIRQALALSVDKELMVDNLLRGLGMPAYTYTVKEGGIIGVSKDFAEEIGDIYPKYDPEKAKELLAEGLKELGLKELPKLSLIFNDSGNNKMIAEFVQESYRSVLGINVELNMMTFAERLSRMEQRDFDLVLAGFSGDYPDAMAYLERFESNNGNNYSTYINPEYDRIAKEIKDSNDQQFRVEKMKELEEFIAEDQPVGLLYFRKNVKLVNPRVKGARFSAIGNDYQLRNAYID